VFTEICGTPTTCACWPCQRLQEVSVVVVSVLTRIRWSLQCVALRSSSSIFAPHFLRSVRFLSEPTFGWVAKFNDEWGHSTGFYATKCRMCPPLRYVHNPNWCTLGAIIGHPRFPLLLTSDSFAQVPHIPLHPPTYHGVRRREGYGCVYSRLQQLLVEQEGTTQLTQHQ